MKFSEQRSDMISLSLLQDKSCSMILGSLFSKNIEGDNSEKQL